MNISAVVLAGGKSTRMKGNNKAYLTYKNEKFIDIILKTLENEFSNIYISVDHKEKYKNFGYELIEDLFSEIGPISGIYSSLKYVESDFILVFPCDMPLINVEVVKCLLRNVQNEDLCIVLKSSNKIYPLCGVYSKKALPIIKEMIDIKDFKLRNLVEKLHGRIILLNEENLNEELLINVNDPNEYDKLNKN